MQVEVLIASCCTPKEIEQKVVSVLQGMKREVPDLTWNVLDVSSDPDIAVKYRAPITPAIVIDGKLEFVGYPKEKALEAMIRERHGK